MKETVSLSAHELQAPYRAPAELRSKSGQGGRIGKSTDDTRTGLQRLGPVLFMRPAASGDCRLVDCLWRRWRRAGSGYLHHRPSFRRPCLGCRSRRSRLHRLFRYSFRIGLSAHSWRGGCAGKCHHPYSDGTEERNNILFRGNGL